MLRFDAPELRATLRCVPELSLNSRTFSIAITAWGCEGLKEFDLLIGERTDLLTTDRKRSNPNHPRATTV